MPKTPKKKAGTAKRPAVSPAQPSAMKLERLSIEALTSDPRNARLHGEPNLAAIAGSLKRFGQQKPIVVDAAGVVVAGNGTLEAAKQLGWTHIDVVRTALKGKAARAFALADNRSAELADWDLEELQRQTDEMSKSFDLPDLGFAQAQLDELLAGLSGETNPPIDETNGADSENSGADPVETNPLPDDTPAGDGQTAPAAGGAEPEITRLVVITCRDEMHQTDLLDAMDQKDGLRIAGLLEGVEFTARNG